MVFIGKMKKTNKIRLYFETRLMRPIIELILNKNLKKELKKYTFIKLAIFITIELFVIFWVDILGNKYWIFLLWFTPLNFLIQFFISKKIFTGKFYSCRSR